MTKLKTEATQKRKAGRPTKEQQIKNAIKAKDSNALELHLTSIRLQLFDLVAQDTEGAAKTNERAKQLQSLKAIYDIGKAVFEDLKREEAANKQQGELLDKLLENADAVTAEMGWDEE